MARRQSKIERFVADCTTATPEELVMMLDILKGVMGKRQPPKPRVVKAKAPKPTQQMQEAAG